MIYKWLSYPRSLVSSVLALLWTLCWSLLTIIGSYFFKAHWWGNFITYRWSQGLLWLFNIRVKVHGEENLNEKNGIFVFNHSSHFDIPILIVALRKKTIRFGAKAELFKIPFFSKAMISIGMLQIHRGQRDKVIELYKQSLKNIETGVNYVLAPEGTRQTTSSLGEFKMGPFIMAISGQVPLLPVVILGAHKIMPKHTLFPAWGRWSSEVHVKILPAETTLDCNMESRQDLRDGIKNKMLMALGDGSGLRDE